MFIFISVRVRAIRMTTSCFVNRCQRLASSASPARKQPGSWVAAAEGLGVKAEGAEGGAEEGAEGGAEEGAEGGADLGDDSDSNGGEFNPDSGFVAPPATRKQIAKLRDDVADSWKWSDSLSGVLCDHWRVHGVGEPAIGSVLTWHSPKRGATADVDRDGDAEVVGKFILTLVWAIGMTSCFVHRRRVAFDSENRRRGQSSRCARRSLHRVRERRRYERPRAGARRSGTW